MQTETIVEKIFAALTGTRVIFIISNETLESHVEYGRPERVIRHLISLPDVPKLEGAWQKYLAVKELTFRSFWQCALEFARFLKTSRDEETTPPTMLGGL